MKIHSKVLVVALFAIFKCSVAAAQPDYIGSSFKPPAHPRLLMFKSDEAGIKTGISKDPVWNGMQQEILAECDAMLIVDPVEKIRIGRRLLDKSRECLRRVFFLSYAWRMTGDEKYFKRAETELLDVSAFDDWNPTHFLDVAEMTMAVSIGYDWLYRDLSPQSRTTIREAILKKGIEPSLDTANNSWLKAVHNWNQVCNAGMAYGAMAIYEDQPELAKKIINRSLESIRLPMGAYKPDGAYPEGYDYWGYGTSFNVMLISAVEKLFGKDFELNELPGFLGTAGFLENMTGPSGDPFNFFDCSAKGELNVAMFWFAAKEKDPSLLWVERTRLDAKQIKRNVKDRLLPAIMIWNAGVSLKDINEPKSTVWVGHGRNPVGLMRTSWSDPNAIFVGMKGGSPSVNHAHMDAGSFVMEADGVRWAMDFGNQNYESLESKKVDLWNMKQRSQRWEVFRYNNKAHNTLTINDGLQVVEGSAPITGFSKNPMFMDAITDLSDIYKGYVSKVNRGIAIVNKKYVVIRDEIETLPKEATFRWNMLTEANVVISGKNKAELTKDGKKLFLIVEEPAGVEMKTWSTTPTHSYDAENPGTTFVGFEVKMPANSKGVLTVFLVPEKAESDTGKAISALQQWPH